MSTSSKETKRAEISEFKKKQKRDQELFNPCFQENNLSLRCLEKQRYDYDKCELYFANYRNCKKFWGQIIRDRKMRHIEPHIPLPEDRERIKNEYMFSQSN